MQVIFRISFFILMAMPVVSQNDPTGFWEGVLTFHSTEHRFEMQIKVIKKKISGVAFLYKTENEVITMRFFGKLHWDRSMNIYELKLNGLEDEEPERGGLFSFPKDYQLVYHRSIWPSTLEGFWQEQIPELLNERSKKGRIYLKKVKNWPKSKA